MRPRRTGRKRKSGDRHPSGQLVQQQEAAIPAAAMERRYELVGKIEHARTIGTAPEAMEQWGMLSRRQREAAETYRLVYIAWACINGIPGRHPLSPGDEGRLRDLLVLLDPVEVIDRERRLIARKREADGLIPPGFARSLIDMIVIEDWEPEVWRRGIVSPAALPTLRATLDRLASFFRIPERERVAS